MLVTKQCTKCRKTKSVAEFHKMPISPDGLTYDCKSCRNKKRNELREESNPRSIDPKKCPSCNISKLADRYNTDGKQRDGLSVYCRSCLSKKRRKS